MLAAVWRVGTLARWLAVPSRGRVRARPSRSSSGDVVESDGRP